MVAGDCDTPEMCDGVATACPTDRFVAAGTECRASTGSCDPAESCDGTAAGCPMDAFEADGAACDDGLNCNEGETCTAGACGGGAATECDDGDVCTADMCAEPGGCANEPIAGCCTDAIDCDDGDECTADTCGGDNTCANDPIPGCVDDGGVVDDDGGVIGADGGVGGDDAGPRPGPPDAGCGCSVPGTEASATRGGLLGLLLLGLLLGRRRRQS